MSGIGSDVDGRRSLVQSGEELRKRVLGFAALAYHHGGDALIHRGQCIEMLENLPIGVAVGVDESGCQSEPSGIDYGLPRARRQVSDRGDLLSYDPHAGLASGRTGSIQNQSVDDDGRCR